MSRLHDKQDKLTITNFLRMGKNAVMKVVGADGSESEVDLTELGVLDGLTATTDELNQAADISGKGEVLVTTRLLTVADNGKTFLLGHATGFTTTLPLMSTCAGFWCKFIVKVVPTSGNDVVTCNVADDDLISGHLDDGEAATVAEVVALADDINFVASTCVIGDWITLECPDGAAWYITGHSSLAASITATG